VIGGESVNCSDKTIDFLKCFWLILLLKVKRPLASGDIASSAMGGSLFSEQLFPERFENSPSSKLENF
jgi:hypothetical protein